MLKFARRSTAMSLGRLSFPVLVRERDLRPGGGISAGLRLLIRTYLMGFGAFLGTTLGLVLGFGGLGCCLGFGFGCLGTTLGFTGRLLALGVGAMGSCLRGRRLGRGAVLVLVFGFGGRGFG